MVERLVWILTYLDQNLKSGQVIPKLVPIQSRDGCVLVSARGRSSGGAFLRGLNSEEGESESELEEEEEEESSESESSDTSERDKFTKSPL